MSVHMIGYNCGTQYNIQHKTVVIIFYLILQTIIIGIAQTDVIVSRSFMPRLHQRNLLRATSIKLRATCCAAALVYWYGTLRHEVSSFVRRNLRVCHVI